MSFRKKKHSKKSRASPGFETGTSGLTSAYHTARLAAYGTPVRILQYNKLLKENLKHKWSTIVMTPQRKFVYVRSIFAAMAYLST